MLEQNHNENAGDTIDLRSHMQKCMYIMNAKIYAWF